MQRVRSILFTAPLFFVALASCASEQSDGATSVPVGDATVETTTETGDAAATGEADAQRFPDVVDAVAVDAGGTWTFDVTMSSPYDSPDRYADAWRVLGPDGTEYGIRELDHDHAGEQPFTRSQSGIEIPHDVSTVTVEGRDQQNGWGGQTVDVVLSGG